MSSSATQTTRITIPEIRREYKLVAGNRLLQLVQPAEELECMIHDHGNKCYLLRDERNRQFILKYPHCQVNSGPDIPILKFKGESVEIDSLRADAELQWNMHPLRACTTDPGQIRESWNRQFQFVEEDSVKGLPGLRAPQIGAVHAIGSHWSVKSDPITIVMPTGTGKTEVMISALVYGQCPCVLILVPTNPLRLQTVQKLSSFGCLKQVSVVSDSALYPRVANLEHVLKSKADARALVEQSNVIVATTNVLSYFDEEVLSELVSGCSHLFIDEAHHVPARTWTKIKDLFLDKSIVQFTATPFRRDGKPLEGTVVYNYPLGLAQEKGYFRPINLVKVEEFDDNAADEKIAEAAINVLKGDLERKLDHVLMVRARSIPRAQELLPIYLRLASEYNPEIVYSGLTKGEKDDKLTRLRNREIRIVICIDMLGEGFDLPNLKIAAIHDIHKSLAITLQFIGRFTRVSANVGEASAIVNLSDPNVPAEIDSLYSENPDWNQLLRQKSETTIQKEIALQELVQSFSGELSGQVSLWNLRPKFSTIIYETDCEEWNPEDFEDSIPTNATRWHAISQTERVLVIVVNTQFEVNWGRYKDIRNSVFDLCIAYWNKDMNALFIQCSDYDVFKCNRLARNLCGSNARPKTGSSMFNVFAEIDRPMARTLGASAAGSIRYTMYFGPDVAVGLSQVEKAQSTLNNIFGWGYENGDKVTVGCSARKGKVWARGGGRITDWKLWCEHVAGKIFDDSIDEMQLISGFLKPEEITERHRSVALAVEWGESLSTRPEDSVAISIGTNQYSMSDIDLKILEFNETGPIKISIASDEHEAKYELSYQGDRCQYALTDGSPVEVLKSGGVRKALEEHVERDPLVVLYADGSFSYNNYLVRVPEVEMYYSKDRIEPIDWTGIDIRIESQGKERRRDSIQYHIAERLVDDYEVVFDDDGKNEAADIIALRQESTEKLRLHFVHCKYSTGDNPGSRVEDFYELCGQAQKSVRWKHSGFQFLADHIKRRERSWRAQNSSRFIKGDMSTLLKLNKQARYMDIEFVVTLVQPGLSKASISDSIIQLLGSTEHYLVRTARATMDVICSE